MAIVNSTLEGQAADDKLIKELVKKADFQPVIDANLAMIPASAAIMKGGPSAESCTALDKATSARDTAGTSAMDANQKLMLMKELTEGGLVLRQSSITDIKTDIDKAVQPAAAKCATTFPKAGG